MIVIEQEGSGWWRVTWHLDEPVTQLAFERKAGGLRHEVFDVQTPGWVVAPDGRMEGPPSQRVEVRIRQFARQLVKEYDFFELFSDGSAAIYTGHYLAGTIRSFRFVPAAGQPFVLEGKRYTRAVDWKDVHGQGTFVYFGMIEPVVNEHMISIVDPGLPDWLEERTRSLLPQLFAFYKKRLGVALPERPTVLFSFTDSDASGYNSGGGTLPSLIQLGVEGKAWQEPAAEGMLHLFHFLAHEAVHLWNGQLIHYPGRDDAWMHEGSADALAERTLLELGFINEERFLEYQTAALNECLRRPDDVYACGNMTALLIEKSGVDLFAFWRRLIEHVLAGDDNLYNADDYTRIAESFAIGDVRPADLATALQSKGLRLMEADPPQGYGQKAVREALVHLLSAHCRGRFGFRFTRSGLLLDPRIDCAGLAGGEVVRTIGGHDVRREGHLVWDHVQRQCASGLPVTVGSAEIACSKAMPPRPPYLRIVAVDGHAPPTTAARP